MVRLEPDGAPERTWTTDANDTVFAVASMPDQRIVLGGRFSELAGAASPRLQRVRADGSVSSLGLGASSTVRAFVVQADGGIIVAGAFNTFGGQTRRRIARIRPDGSLDPNFNPNVIGSVRALAEQADGGLIVIGDFSEVNDQPRARVARLSANGSLDPDYIADADGAVLALAVLGDGKALLGGDFSEVNGQARDKLARLSAHTRVTQSLYHDGVRARWLRGGSAAELAMPPTLEWSLDGENFSPVSPSAVSPIAGGWQLDGVEIPTTGGYTLRASGTVRSGFANSSVGRLSYSTRFFADRIHADRFE